MSTTRKDVRYVHQEHAGKCAPGRIDQLHRMEIALQEDNPRPFRRSFLRLYFCIFAGYLCSVTNGFDSNTFGGLSAMPSFMDYFGINSQNQGLVAALYVIGNITGSLIAGPCADTHGRRVGMALGSAICILGAVLQTVATTIDMLMGGRFVLGVGAAVVQRAGPAYVVEMAYPKYRAQLAGGFQACFFLGTILSTFLEYGLSLYSNIGSVVWRLPLAVQGLPSVILLLVVWFLPESPRWYIAHDRLNDARNVLIKYHGDGNPDSKVVDLEIEEMREVISQEGADKRFWDIRDLFNTRAARHRTFLVTCIAWFAQLDLPPTSYYFPLMVKTAGISDSQTQLLLNAIQTPIMMTSALCGLYFIHSFGRRTLLMISSVCMTVCLSIMTACTAHQKGKPLVGGVGIAFLYLFLVVFAFAWTPMQSLYPCEILAYNSRAKGLAFMNLMLNTANVLNTYVPPVGISRCGWRFYFMYICWDAFGILVIYLFFIETKGWNLEEIEHLFRSRHPVKQSLQRTN